MPARNEIRENPGGRRMLVRAVTRRGGPRGDLWGCLQLNGRYAGEGFGVPAQELDGWTLLATLPPEGQDNDERSGDARRDGDSDHA